MLEFIFWVIVFFTVGGLIEESRPGFIGAVMELAFPCFALYGLFVLLFR